MKLSGALADSPVGRLLRRYAQFCVVGGSGVVVDMAFIYVLASPAMLGWNLSLSKAIAAEVAIFNNYVGNELWTFRGLGGGGNRLPQRLARLLKFNLICLAGIVWSVGLLNAQVYWLGLNVYLANFIAIVLVSLWNFFMNLRFGWNLPAARMLGKADRVGSICPARQTGNEKRLAAADQHRAN